MVIARAIPTSELFGGRYRIVEKIGDGTVASVYRSLDERSDTEVALKVFDPLRSADPIARLRFEREFAILSQVELPGLARALRFERHGDLDVLVMEYVEGESLADRLLRGRLEIQSAVALAVSLAKTLAACHRAGVIHRDLKPANVILSPTRGPVIVDFGVAWFSGAMTLTRTGAIVGSPRYVAPEAFRSSDTDERADVFSLGAILYEALTGRSVRDAESIAELALAGFVEPPRPSSLRADIPEWLDAVVMRAVASRAEDRFATASELLGAIARAADIPAKRLEANLPCKQCGVPSIVDLPLCPGCGLALEWSLVPGPYAVQILEVRDPRATAAWLRRRHGDALRLHWRWLAARLTRPPIPVALGISRTTADALASSLGGLGCRTEIIRARAVLGPNLAAPNATPRELAVALSLHLAATVSLGAILAFAATPATILPLAPIAVSLLGLLWARWYVRRPLLRVRSSRPQDNLQTPLLERMRNRLGRLQTPRARALGAAAVARAAPLFMNPGAIEEGERTEAVQALDRALDAAAEIDVHAQAMAEERAQRRADQTASPALASDPKRHAGASLAYDIAARQVLEACEAITQALLPPQS